MQALMNIDRRIIFLVVAGVLLIGTLVRPKIPLPISSESQKLYDAVEAIPDGGAILVAMDYPPSTAGELDPMSKAVLYHAFSRNLRVVALSFDRQGVAAAAAILEASAKAQSKQEGTDFVFLGFQPDITAALIQMGTSIPAAFPEITIGETATPTGELPVMQGITKLGDLALAIQMTGSKTYEDWINYANARFGLKLCTGATGSIVTGLYPYLSSGQITGLLRSTRGASDYEQLVNGKYPGLKPNANLQMSVQFLAHLMLILFIVLANIGYWVTRNREGDLA